jgi:TonB family protein
VLILLGIAVDGTVEDAQIVRSTGDESANAAALDYARATRWIPGNVSGEPRAMKASLTVILGEIA